MRQPRVSVCIDVYNYADFLQEAIESVLTQRLSDFELIVVDDCSTDSSYDVALKYSKLDDRIRVHRNVTNQGMIGNRNTCLRLATCEFVKFLHADDTLHSTEALSKMMDRIEANSAAALVACGMQFIGPGSDIQKRSKPWLPDNRFFAGTSIITRCLAEQKNLIGGPSSTIFRRACATRGFHEGHFHAADLEMWFHLLEQGCYGSINEPLVGYRLHGRQQTEKDRATLSQMQDQQAILDAYLDKPYVRLRRWMKDYLRHDNVRQTLQRAARIGHAEAAVAALSAYGASRYRANYPIYYFWRKVAKSARKFSGSGMPYAMASSSPSTTTSRVPSRRPHGLNIAGFLQGQYGIGSSSRAFCRAAEETGLPHALINIESRDHSNRDASVERFSRDNPYGVNLMTFSFDYARRFYRDRGPRFFQGRRNVAIWYWELESFPSRWHSEFDYYDEIWTPTRFCADAFSSVSPIPVRRINYPLYHDHLAAPDRSAYGLNDESIVFLFSFDFFSTVARKNPQAVIEAFRLAFRPEEDAILVLKSINAQHDPAAHDELQRLSTGLNVKRIDSHLSGPQMDSLIASSDCYVSLHRSEGLGLGMAQAMSAGKPVIATGYSGNLEFMSDENSLLVSHKLVELDQNHGPFGKPHAYDKGSIWAEPDIEDAARKMRWVFEHRTEAAALGLRGQADVRVTMDPTRTREFILEQL